MTFGLRSLVLLPTFATAQSVFGHECLRQDTAYLTQSSLCALYISEEVRNVSVQ